jgi:hypothetical protein
MDKIKQNLEKIVVWVGLITAIGGGFTVYGEMNEKINSLAGLDLNPLLKEIANQNIKIEKQNNKIAILNKTIQVLELELKELKASSKNPLAN